MPVIAEVGLIPGLMGRCFKQNKLVRLFRWKPARTNQADREEAVSLLVAVYLQPEYSPGLVSCLQRPPDLSAKCEDITPRIFIWESEFSPLLWTMCYLES